MKIALSKFFKNSIIALLGTASLLIASSMTVTAADNVADQYPIDYSVSGTLNKAFTECVLKFDSNASPAGGRLSKKNTIVTLKFKPNPYEIRYFKGLSDDITTNPRLNPGYPANTKAKFDDASITLRTYYEANTERVGRSYTIRFDSNDKSDNRGSTKATLVNLKYTATNKWEVTGLGKNHINTDKLGSSLVRQYITDWLKTGTGIYAPANRSITILNNTTENRGFDGYLTFNSWSLFNQAGQRVGSKNNYASGETLTGTPNLTTEYGGLIDAVAQWNSKTFKFNEDFSEVTRTGYDFVGWYSKATGKLITSNNPYLTVTPAETRYEDVLIAQWRAKTYRIILDYNYPGGGRVLHTVNFDDTLRNLPVPYRAGYTFLGWYTDRSGGEEIYSHISNGHPDSDTDAQKQNWIYNHGLVLYAHWALGGPTLLDTPRYDPSIPVGYDYLVPESQIVRVVELSKNDRNVIILADHYWHWSYVLSCPGHYYNGTTVYCTAFDSSGLAIDNLNFASYPSVMSSMHIWSDYDYILDQEDSVGNADVIVDTPGEVGSESVESNTNDSLVESGSLRTRHNYNVAFHRGDDRLTLAKWKNTNTDVAKLRYFSVDNTKSDDERSSNGWYTKSINVHFVGNTTNALVRQAIQGLYPCSDGGGRVYATSGDFSRDLTIAYKVFKGTSGNKPNSTYNPRNNLNFEVDTTKERYDTNIDFDGSTTTKKAISGDRILSGVYNSSTHTTNTLTFSFYPYIRMRYDTIDALGNTSLNNDAYVLGDYLRSLTLNDFAEVTYDKKYIYDSNTTYALKIDSTQWLTDINTDKLGANANVLPGGATLTLSTTINDRQHVTLRTYQCTLSNAGKEQVALTHPSSNINDKAPSYADMSNYHLEYVKSFMSALDNVEITQWQYYSNNIDEVLAVAEKWSRGDVTTPGTKVYAGSDLTELNTAKGISGNNIASTDAKYYFRGKGDPDRTKTNRADFDVRYIDSDTGDIQVSNIRTTHQTFTFRADTEGNIWMNSNIILRKHQDESVLTGNAKAINDRTLVVTKLRDTLEYNKGSDPDCPWAYGMSDGRWYNEAFDGIDVYVFETILETGMIDDNNRTQVLDPKLNTNSTGTASSYGSFAVNQFRTEIFSYKYGSTAEKQVGEFKGNKVHMNGLETLYISKPFYTSNTTVQDKH